MCCLVITMLTWIFNSFMFWPYMLLKTTCCFCLEITGLTRIFNSFMFWPYMLLKTTCRCSLVITDLTRIFYTCVLWLYMIFKGLLGCCLVITMLTWVFYSFIFMGTPYSCSPYFNKAQLITSLTKKRIVENNFLCSRNCLTVRKH